MSLLEVQEITKKYPVSGQRLLTALNRVSFYVNAGETLAIVGESGSGKTTASRVVLGLTPATSGSVRFRGVETSQLTPARWLPLRRHIQAVFQDPFDSLDPRYQIGAIIEEPLRFLTGLNQAARAKRVRDLLDEVRLQPDILDTFPHNLTAGELQRVAIARALAPEPEFLVLDEPTSSLDPIAREEIISLLRRLQATTGTAYLFISHDLVTVKHLSHRIAVMYLGEVVEEGPVREVFETPAHPYTKALLASAPSIEARLAPDLGLSGEIPSPIDLPRGCYLASRCPFVLEACRGQHPNLEATEPGRTSRCLRNTGHLPALPANSTLDRQIAN
jgi:oligopeptide/dipeptide ABC transporter ATP-binding protein